ncbi:hypothetical protein F5148DRAFT_984406 [Russula earlei]|uniref:Uncharacterized protein n=1 Tax=Russula earlei TaxID=71964 RepID=A0ACC0U1B3_9AGAM|nr:hypothetical protein F5148DRAFT_984406 [Russula earlei]
MVLLSPTLILFFSLPVLVLSSANTSQADTRTCNPARNGLASGTLQFNSDCNVTTWCNNGRCEKKGCRRDLFPLGYNTGGGSIGNGKNIPPPAFCADTEFCPDEGSQCVPQIAVGQPCQFNRDDSCQPPPNQQQLQDTNGLGRNVNGSICLNFVCQYANVTAGNQCELENTGYIGYGASQFVYIVSRMLYVHSDNCMVGLYCDTNSTTCIQQKAIGESCSADKECLTYNCMPNLVCGVSPSNPRQFPTWVYIVAGTGIFGGMIVTLVVLFCIHRRQRDNEREKRRQYWREQNAFRQNILQMHETAQASLFLQPGSRRSALFGTSTEDSHAPMMQYGGTPGGGQRQYVTEDGSYEGGYDEQLIMRTPYMHDNRI